MMTIQYTKNMKVSNLESLPSGTGAKFLIVMEDFKGRYIAKRWARKEPVNLRQNEVAIKF